MQTGTFTKINEAFQCEHCGRQVPVARSTCRNHCPYCLYSKHVDINPGDRSNNCGGLLKPIAYELSAKKGIVIIFKCTKCMEKVKNRALPDDPICPDNYDAILNLNKNI